MTQLLRWVQEAHQPGRLMMFGHSTGGILAGLAGVGDLVDAMVTVGSENPYWRYDHRLKQEGQLTLASLA